MEWPVFFKGLAADFVVCAPMGPVGLLCLRRCLVDSPLEGFASLPGVSTADGLYCLIAAFGVACIGNLLMNEQTLIPLLGGIVLVAVGANFFSRPESRGNEATPRGLLDAWWIEASPLVRERDPESAGLA